MSGWGIPRLCAAAAVLALWAGGPALAVDRLAITHVTLVDGTDRAPLKDATVVVEGAKIVRIVAGGAPPPRAQVIDGRGRFLIPGLWNNDLHGISYDQAKSHLPDLLAHGVTSVRDMGSPLDDIVRLRSEIASGELTGPRLYIAGPLLEGPVDIKMPLIVDLFSDQAARDEVAALKRSKVDYVEVDTTLTPALYETIAAAARREGLALVGHIPAEVPAEAVVAAGQKDVEHLGGRFLNVQIGCSRDAPALRKIIAETYAGLLVATKQGRQADEPQFKAAFGERLLRSFDDRRCRRLLRLYARNGVAQTPTLDVLRSLWAMNQQTDKLSDADLEYGRRVFELDLRIVGEMKKAGVVILAGADGGYAQGGEALDRELELLVRAGLTPVQALQAASRDAAAAVGAGAEVGTLEVGKTADMVLLDADPLADIANVRRVKMVIVRGRPFAPARPARPAASAAPAS